MPVAPPEYIVAVVDEDVLVCDRVLVCGVEVSKLMPLGADLLSARK